MKRDQRQFRRLWPMVGMVGQFLRPAGLVLVTSLSPAAAQDIRGVEVCTAEKQMERRTGCLQANVEFLEQALAKGPGELETWGLLGDLAVRHGDYRLARIDYRHASSLDPLDPVLHSLATGPLPATAY